ncbi:FUSC family protein [Corynebacterium lizhenjunii]|uniref:FUSC family protein n=1 Tax=Corynebacterium lizhenjunii TaxID=2709394 RepID=A0A7T0KIM8_9CORY|nr:FUSC family protein [Corynebacterium lizhenjunii]QPK80418.1 FUSC family protein [Corynebacterium lizhenjunii]
MTTAEQLRHVDKSLKARLGRVRSRLVYILQATLGAGLAFYVAHEIFGHAQPFFAPMSVVIILGLSGSDRLQRALELSLGGIVGVVVGTFLVDTLGTGAIHMTIIIGLSLLISSFMTSSQLVSNQITIGAILISTILPPAEMGGLSRALDAIIGAVIGIGMIALIPSSPLSAGRREISKVLGLASSVLSDVASGLRERDPQVIRDAREAVRGSQADINALLAAAKSGKETAQVNPLLWGSMRSIRSLERTLAPVDNAVRGVRVLARRALVLVEDRDHVSATQLELIEELADVCHTLSQMYSRSAKAKRLSEAEEIPELVARLRVVGARAQMSVVEEDHLLSAYAILAQTRSIVVDLLMVCGMSRESAVAALAPTSKHPAYPPELPRDLR